MSSKEITMIGTPASPSRSGQKRPAMFVRAAVREPFTRRSLNDLLFCVIGVLIGAVELATIVALLALILVPLLVASGGARRLGETWRRLAAALLGERVPAPPPLVLGPRLSGRLATRLRDGAGWRVVAYMLLKLPLAFLGLYALSYWAGLINLTYPFWWRLFRNHPPGVQLRPVPFITPFGAFSIRTFVGTFMVFAVSTAMVIAAPWVTRAIVEADRRFIRSLLGPGRLAQRVRDLEETRAHFVGDSAATLRRIERDLHDGTQAQLATLAMNLGQAKEKLEGGSQVPVDPAGALELVETAHRHAKEALVELRDIARGIHPPALDVGLDAALATLVARSAVPANLEVDVPIRPAMAIETIAYFSVAELLANVAKHSRARHATVEVSLRSDRLRLNVTDDGIGGALPGNGTGLNGLADRVGAVDGDMQVSSPPGGPTVITVELPLRP